MINGSFNQPPKKSDPSRVALIAGLGTVTLLMGVAVFFGMTQLQAQKQQLAQANELMAQLAQASSRTAGTDQAVTRAASPDLIALLPVAQAPAQIEPAQTTPSQAASPAALVQRVVASAGFSPTLQTASAPAQSTALRSTPSQSEANADDTLRNDVLKFETLAIIQAGIEDLASAVVAGDYDVNDATLMPDASGRIHLSFKGHEENQSRLEGVIAAAAKKGFVKHSAAVVGSDGSINGHILLCNLVERVLENGSVEQQRAGQQMMDDIKAVLRGNAPKPAAKTASGQKFYVVERGDSLAYIALQFYGSTNQYVRIFEANRSQIVEPDNIRVGQRLLIPTA